MRNPLNAVSKIDLLIGALVIGIFALDLQTPLGVAIGLLYVIPVWLTVWSTLPAAPLALSLVCSVLTVLGAVLGPPGLSPLWYGVVNRAMSIAVITVGGYFARREIASRRVLASEMARREAAEMTLREVARRRQAEEALRDSEERFRLLVSSIQDYAIFMLAPDGRVATWNAGAAHIKGYAADEIIDQHFSRFYSSEEVQRGKPDLALKKAAADGTFKDEGWRIRKDGSRFWANVLITAIRDQAGILRGFSKVTHDLTERKLAEEERDRIFTLSPDLFCIAGFDGYFKELNPAWETTLGYTRQELLASPYLDFVHPDDRTKTAAEAHKTHSGQQVIVFENRYRCKDGSYRWLLWNSTPVVEAQLAYAAARDITDRKRLEEEREKLIIQLQDTLARVKSLEGILPICAHCKRIRDDQGQWQAVEAYVSGHTNADFSHGICPVCLDKHYPGIDFKGRPPGTQGT